MINFSSYIGYNEIIQIIIRMIFGCVIGGIIGFERELKNHPAGLRTHLIVCLSACLMMILSLIWYEITDLDTSRLAQGVISGFGFIGAGTILRDGDKIRGLTTAASIWIVACLGLMVGSGLYVIASIATILIIIILFVLGNIGKKLGDKNYKIILKINVDNVYIFINKFYLLNDNWNIKVENINIDYENNYIKSTVYNLDNKKVLNYIIKLGELEGIKKLVTIHIQ